jgi:hypothetical protein
VLKIEHVGIHESFFDLGGHSILAARMMAQLHASFGVQFLLYDIFRAPTISRLAVLIESKLWTARESHLADAAASGPQVEIEI